MFNGVEYFEKQRSHPSIFLSFNSFNPSTQYGAKLWKFWLIGGTFKGHMNVTTLILKNHLLVWCNDASTDISSVKVDNDEYFIFQRKVHYQKIHKLFFITCIILPREEPFVRIDNIWHSYKMIFWQKICLFGILRTAIITS